MAKARTDHAGVDHVLAVETPKAPALFVLSPEMQAAAARFTSRTGRRSTFTGNFVQSW